jgi:hypothetical protein
MGNSRCCNQYWESWLSWWMRHWRWRMKYWKDGRQKTHVKSWAWAPFAAAIYDFSSILAPDNTLTWRYNWECDFTFYLVDCLRTTFSKGTIMVTIFYMECSFFSATNPIWLIQSEMALARCHLSRYVLSHHSSKTADNFLSKMHYFFELFKQILFFRVLVHKRCSRWALEHSIVDLSVQDKIWTGKTGYDQTQWDYEEIMWSISSNWADCWGFKSTRQPTKIAACDPQTAGYFFFKLFFIFFIFRVMADLGFVIKQFTRKNPVFLVCRMSGLRLWWKSVTLTWRVNKLKVVTIEYVYCVFMISAWRSQLTGPQTTSLYFLKMFVVRRSAEMSTGFPPEMNLKGIKQIYFFRSRTTETSHQFPAKHVLEWLG